MAASPTERTLVECRRRGWTAQVVERWIPQARRRLDLFGCIDVVAIDGTTLWGIQACAGSSHSARRAKALAEPRFTLWLRTGARFAVWSWARRGPRGKVKRWQLREEELLEEE